MHEFASVAFTLKLKFPEAVEVPLMSPELERDNPVGNEPVARE